MLYQAYQSYADVSRWVRNGIGTTAAMFGHGNLLSSPSATLRAFSAVSDLLDFTAVTHVRPSFGISSIVSGERELPVTEQAFDRTPFATLLRFVKEGADAQPRVLLVAPMSGHFATLLRATVRTLLPDHDVYITDWHNARDVAVSDGRFGFDEYVQHMIRFQQAIGPGGHIVAVCQPCVAALAAAAIMAEDDDPAAPRSVTLMAGPIDTRVNPTEVNRLAQRHTIDWFERELISIVPLRHRGALRRVYPGFLQLFAFMSMNPGRHSNAFHDYVQHRVRGEDEQAEAIREFYLEYFATADLPAEFYLETVRLVFQEHALPLGQLVVGGRRIDPAALRRCMLFTVEGERDDICAVGQTLAAQDLCSSLRPYLKRHHVQTGAGHYGVFAGRRWEREIYPILRDVIHYAS